MADVRPDVTHIGRAPGQSLDYPDNPDAAQSSAENRVYIDRGQVGVLPTTHFGSQVLKVGSSHHSSEHPVALFTEVSE